jgi:hypothetical protein
MPDHHDDLAGALIDALKATRCVAQQDFTAG